MTVPVTGTMRAAVDMNNDDLDDVVGINTETIDNVAYTTGVTIAYQQSGGGFTAVSYPTPQIPNTPSWSLCAGDLDGNGWNDLLIAGGSKVTLLFADADGNGFSNDTTYNQYVFCQRSNMVDINNDGLLDAFSCHDVQPNVYFINNGTGTFTYYQGG
ncbi:MAG: FG-GAP repeat domain-containing protein, partial [Flavobacteriales bacterium]